MNIAVKIPQYSFSIIAWLFLFLFFFHGWCYFFLNSNNIIHNNNNVHVSPRTLSNRKMLVSNVDFTAIMSRHHQRHMPMHSDPTRGEIDPLYGVEKRLVPTGPNPLHH
ncbi:hypothetical protein POPTR_012G059600v4 [Populus trichocarpa]|uniref:Uncharacterized protein n=1 Tax=Populus trichocarpa TaxID=3694 RepID=A0A2K1Y9J6_POPTR|nr:hypothetical protein POPTR_012G059600v4 [Populus trichocarpa]